MRRTANGQSDQPRILRQEDVTVQVSGVLHDTALDAVTGGARMVCSNNLKQIALGIHN